MMTYTRTMVTAKRIFRLCRFMVRESSPAHLSSYVVSLIGLDETPDGDYYKAEQTIQASH